MQVRVDPDNAAVIRKRAADYRRTMKRRKSVASIANEIIRKGLAFDYGIPIKTTKNNQ